MNTTNLLEEYKLLEKRYQADTSRIWSQAQVLMAANLLAMTLLGSMFSAAANKERLIDPRCAISGVSLLGVSISLAWFFSVAMDSAYQDFSRNTLRDIERRLELPIKVFSQAEQKRKDFKPWQKVGGEKALVCLSFIFVVAWFLLFIAGLLSFFGRVIV